MAAAVTPALGCHGSTVDFGPLRPDPDKLLDLPDGFDLTIVSRAGQLMSDGFTVPSAHDGMAAFPGDEGRVILVCNHEMTTGQRGHTAFRGAFDQLPESIRRNVYDPGGGRTPGAGGTTTTVYHPGTRQVERQYLSLAGTEVNCAGGPTPWGSWLSCEECFVNPGTSFPGGREVIRVKRHGFVFEVPARSEGLVEPVPLTAMGRFEHEGAAVHEPSGVIYLTEDRHDSLFYRFIPASPGELARGGRLQALVIRGRPAQQTRNWGAAPDILPGEQLGVEWLDLDNVAPDRDDLRLRGARDGAATFARSEGICNADGEFFFACTIGGAARLGQIFRYRPSAYEGTDRERENPGTLTLVAESAEDSILRNADNLTMAPWGDLVVCEDTSQSSSLVGIRPDGSQYLLADNAWSGSELAGVCFSPDGKTLFLNIQSPGTTVAITGPWPT